jgi:hypothetical protein
VCSAVEGIIISVRELARHDIHIEHFQFMVGDHAWLGTPEKGSHIVVGITLLGAPH